MKQESQRPIKLPKNPLLIWITLGLICGLYALPHRTMMRIFYMILLAILFDMIHMAMIKKKISLHITGIQEQVDKGEKVQLKINIKNASFLPTPYIYILLKPSYHLRVEKAGGLCVTLQGHEEKSFKVDYTGVLSGQEEIGIEQVILVDYFELMKKKLKVGYTQKVMVMPQLVNIVNEQDLEYLSQKDADDGSQNLYHHDDGELGYELAPYQEGQSQRLVHWKLVAQRDIYMVRERELPKEQNENRLIILDPVSKQIKYEPRLIHKLWKSKKYKYQCSIGKRQAELEDYRIIVFMSYLYEVINRGESIKLVYCLENQWKKVILDSAVDLERLQGEIEQSLMNQKVTKENRWPEIEELISENSVLISANVDEQLIKYVEEQPNLILLALQRSQMKYRGNRYAYISKDYKICSSI